MLLKLYDNLLRWSAHKYASYYLAAVSFAESSFFPIPPDVMLAPMSLAKPVHAFRFAGIATISSVIGGVAGYLLGKFAFDPVVLPYLTNFGYLGAYNQVLEWFSQWGFWLILLAGFSPIPYKLFTVGAGVMHFNFFLFFLASIIGRAARFYLVAGLIYWGGEKMAKKLRKIVDKLGWGVILLFSFILVFKWI